ncbi:MAG TPA: aminotransferase class I/II-fold pyridoxal phosphate-dependent enzyme [Candidatus Magasanikbacteria bacterium]|jgi:8-amino-7-oxononanoate synthase|nr:aminotransferase class I/II-fold pyridoxal phosphate-dependent enzyme [Syntrophomonadaceae bacterium]HQF57010.1 aminotransferase class I/II-fold pyridoxal phosphate-dependent enzyme [Candidatus Magasanikbacteria bacterium]HQL52705.1 aminotransferase class I/II-fold pyridoxal phosphate-dependent enzyme [Candidatus Magasanikbacteria bacterium]
MVNSNGLVARAEQVTRAIREANYFPKESVIEGLGLDAIVVLNGRKILNFASNGYLSLHNHPKVIEAAKEALIKFGFGTGGSRVTSGTQSPHVELEQRIAQFKGHQAAVVFSTGYNTNVGVLSAIVGNTLRGVENMLGVKSGNTQIQVFSDALNHASIIDGLHLARGFNRTLVVSKYSHRNMKELESLLSKSTADYKLIITDGVFSLHGRIALVDEIVKLAHQYNAEVYVDDAHGVGVLGPTGRGTAEHFGLEKEIAFSVGTLSKALGGAGGYLVGSEDLCDYLRVSSRSYMFQTAMPASIAAGLVAAFDVIEQEPHRRIELMENASWFRKELICLGFNIFDSQTQIIPVCFFDEQKAKLAAARLEEAGIFAPPYYYPAVGLDEAEVRLNLVYGHKQEHLCKVLEVLEKVGKETGVIH